MRGLRIFFWSWRENKDRCHTLFSNNNDDGNDNDDLICQIKLAVLVSTSQHIHVSEEECPEEEYSIPWLKYPPPYLGRTFLHFALGLVVIPVNLSTANFSAGLVLLTISSTWSILKPVSFSASVNWEVLLSTVCVADSDFVRIREQLCAFGNN